MSTGLKSSGMYIQAIDNSCRNAQDPQNCRHNRDPRESKILASKRTVRGKQHCMGEAKNGAPLANSSSDQTVIILHNLCNHSQHKNWKHQFDTNQVKNLENIWNFHREDINCVTDTVKCRKGYSVRPKSWVTRDTITCPPYLKQSATGITPAPLFLLGLGGHQFFFFSSIAPVRSPLTFFTKPDAHRNLTSTK